MGKNTVKDASNLCIVFSAMNRTGFDFVGKFNKETDNEITLDDPLVLNYEDEQHTLRNLMAAHLPFGIVDVQENHSYITIPKAGVAYIVHFPEDADDWLHNTYKMFFNGKEQIEQNI